VGGAGGTAILRTCFACGVPGHYKAACQASKTQKKKFVASQTSRQQTSEKAGGAAEKTAETAGGAADDDAGTLDGFSLCQLCAVDDDRVDDTDREITFTVDSGACKTVVPLDHPAVRGYRVHKDATTGVSYGTAMKNGKKILDEGKRVLQTKVNGAGVPQRLDTRKADVSKPLLAVCQMVDANHTVLF
jgi:hypothetical protein